MLSARKSPPPQPLFGDSSPLQPLFGDSPPPSPRKAPRAPDKSRQRLKTKLENKVREFFRAARVTDVKFFERDDNCGSYLTGKYSYNGKKWFFFKLAETKVINSHIRGTDRACARAHDNAVRDLLGKHNATFIPINHGETTRLQGMKHHNFRNSDFLVCDYVNLRPCPNKTAFEEIVHAVKLLGVHCDVNPHHGEQNFAVCNDTGELVIFDLLDMDVEELYSF